jgi:spore coat polysaccharide biosynthesis protein SpsF
VRTVGVIQARMGSTRLPGKVMLDLGGGSVLARVIERVRQAELDAVVVATTRLPADDVIVEEAQRCGAQVYRGSEDDVLDRYWRAAGGAGAQAVVRVTSDCPLLDPALLAQMVRAFCERQPLDYLSNTIQRTYPRGLDVEVFLFSALERAAREARLPEEREHVTPYIYRHPELFSLAHWSGERDDSALRWTLDTPADYQLLQAIYSILAPHGEPFSTAQALDLVRRRPDLATMNAHVEQKALANH